MANQNSDNLVMERRLIRNMLPEMMKRNWVVQHLDRTVRGKRFEQKQRNYQILTHIFVLK